MDMNAVEATRARFRPARITTLFVGESAPASGAFFYYDNSAMACHMKRAIELAFGKSADFLESFKAYGWYLDDLVLMPVNKKTKLERQKECRMAQNCLAERIAKYRPLAIVSLLLSIEPNVDAAADKAGSSVPRFPLPFPGMGHQARFQTEMAAIIRKLPKS
ncbi:MAG TPA: hypothetical protein VGN05_13965 [Parvibaculum sp.]|jgi:hypothetical protein